MTYNINNWKRTFALIWSGQLFSLLSSTAVNFAITIFLTLQYQSAEVLTYATIAGLLPTAIIGPFAGVFIDRWNKKYTMMLADAFIAVCTLLMAIAMIFGFDSLLFIYLMLALRAVGSAFHFPAMQASMPLLAPKEELLRISGMNQGIQSISFIAGPALGGVLVGIFPNSLGTILFFDVIGAVIAISFLSFVRFPEHIATQAKNTFGQVITEMKEGFQTILSISAVKWVFFYSIITMFAIMPIISILPLMTTEHFKGGVDIMTYVEVSYPIGMMAGGILLAIWKPKFHALTIASISMVVIGLICFLSGFLPQNMVWIFIAFLAILGIVNTIEYASMNAFYQIKVPQEKLGRVMSIQFSISSLPSIFGLIFVGTLTEKVGGVAVMFALCGIIVLLVGIIQYLTPAIQKTIVEDKNAELGEK